MSGFTVIFQRDHKPLDAAVLGRVNNAIRHRGPDGSGSWIDGPVGLAHQMLRTTPEAQYESQPALNARGDFVLVYEGLIDNAIEIRRAARAARLRVPDETDATAILLAYELWKDECANHLSGDFAFAIWDSVARRLFCARDPLGIRPFYYHLSDRLFVCGSELRQLLKHPDIRQDPNEGMAAEYLSSSVTSVDETLYRHINRLPAGHSLVVSSTSSQLRRYWRFDPTRQIRFRTDEEYSEALLAEIRSAVRACVRTAAPIGMELSGGLDSTSVASMVRHLADRGEVRQPLHALNVEYPGLGCDEGAFVHEADRHWHLSTVRVPFTLPLRSDFDATLLAHRDFPECPNGAAQRPLYRAAHERGCRVLLGGLGGDDCLGGHYLHYVDLLTSMKLSDLREQLRDDGLTPRALMRFALRPLVPATVRRFARVVRRAYPDWISDRFARTVGLPDRLYRPRFDRGLWQSRAQEEIFRDLTNGWSCYVHETLSRVLAEHGLEQRSPLLRLNVIEFALAIPEDQRRQGTESKRVLRRAMKGLLPERIRTRRSKADFSALFPMMLSRLDASSAFHSLRLTSLGWLNGPRVRQMHDGLSAWRADSSVTDVAIWPLWMIFGVERWFAANYRVS